MLTFDNIKYFTGTLNEFTENIFNNRIFSPANKIIITHINLRNYFYLNKNNVLKKWVKNNCNVILDGIGLKIAFWLKGFGWMKDLNGTDLYPLFMKRLQNSGKNIYYLGSEKLVIQDAVINTLKLHPGIKICGYNHGFFNKKNEEMIINKINICRTDILIVGMGFPLQEEFIMRNKDKLNVSLIWFVGGLFDYISGKKPRAPSVFRKLRFEWLFRFLLEPRRMFYRNTVCAFGAFKHILTR